MASVCKRCRHGRGGWDSCGCRAYLRRRVGGRETFTPLEARDMEGARREAQRLLDRDAAPSARMDALMGRWQELRAAAPDARPNSLASDAVRVPHVVRWFGPMRVDQVRPEDCVRFCRDLVAGGLAPSTVRGIYAALTSALRMALREGLIRTLPLPADGPGIPTGQKEKPALTLAQVDAVIALLDSPWRETAELVLLTGLRWGEVVEVRHQDISGGVLRVARTRNKTGGTNPPKTRAGVRAVPLSPRAAELVAGLDLPIGGSYATARTHLVAAMRAAGVWQPRMGWHTLRNAHATLLDGAGVTLRDAAARMGHGHHYAQTLAYGLRAEAGSAEALDALRHGDDARSAPRGAARRAARSLARRRRRTP
jgi:integrase